MPCIAILFIFFLSKTPLSPCSEAEPYIFYFEFLNLTYGLPLHNSRKVKVIAVKVSVAIQHLSSFLVYRLQK
jgi:hypothetical protein